MGLVNQGGEPSTIIGTTLEAIKVLGVTESKYNEAKEILQSKFGGEQREFQALWTGLKRCPPSLEE